MGFLSEIQAHNAKVELDLLPAVFVGVVAEALNSIKFGSPLTGSPGQPVETEALRLSWGSEFEDANTALISAGGTAEYNQQNEDGIARPGGGSYIQRSAVGGRWSVALTRTGFQRIVDDVAAKLTEGGDPRPGGFQDNSVLGGSGS